MRVGWGSQSRTLTAGLPLHLGGCAIAHESGLGGRLQGDVVCHSVLEALLSACGLPNYELMFETEEEESDTEPLVVLAQTATGLYRQRLQGISNVVVKLALRKPDLSSYRKDMLMQLASALRLHPDQVTVSFEQNPAHLPDLPPDTVRAQASLSCVTGPVLKSKQQHDRFLLQQSVAFEEDREPESDEFDENAPERVKQFEKAVQSKLPPLPAADPPQAGATLIVYSDGASRGNPGPSSTGWVVLNEQGLLVHEGGEAVGRHTNNQAEYLAVQAAAKWIEQQLGRNFTLDLRLDSELVVKQLLGEWKVKDRELKQLAMQTLNLLMYFDSFEIRHVPRAENRRADALANKALDEERKSPRKKC